MHFKDNMSYGQSYQKVEEVIGIAQEHEWIQLDFILRRNDGSNSTIRVIQ